MTHYVLVHGAWEGSWTWDFTAPVLEEKGHQVTTVDLPGSHSNEAKISDVSMERYIQTVTSAISQLDHKVVLVGHSLAGAVISQVAELLPEKMEKLIYVTAFLLQNGDSPLDAMQRDPGSEFLSNITFSEDQSYASASVETVRRFAFHDVNEERIQHSLPLMAAQQATEPFVSKVSVSLERFGKVRKLYIRTTEDKMISYGFQNEMIDGWDVEEVRDLASGHFPTLSVPEELAKLML
ncbi:MAG: alpha/beta fold hydrolase [Sneathiella sp.]